MGIEVSVTHSQYTNSNSAQTKDATSVLTGGIDADRCMWLCVLDQLATTTVFDQSQGADGSQRTGNTDGSRCRVAGLGG